MTSQANRYNPTMIFSTYSRVAPQHEALRTIVLMRAISLVCQILVVALAQFWLGISLPLPPLLAAILFLAAFNIWTGWRMKRIDAVGDTALFMQLLVDVATLSALLYFSGGATNPFVSFYLPALAVAAAILPWLYASILAVFSVAAYSMLASNYVPLHIMDPERAVTYHLAGMWANFAVSAALITWFVAHMSRAVRERDTQLGLAREEHLQNERIVALGAQAANAAHEMGTPLSTVAVIAGELMHEAKHDATLAAYAEDIATIETQIALCKTVLDQMGQKAKDDAATQGAAVELHDWLRQFVGEWRLRHPEIRVNLSPCSSTAGIGNTRAIGQILSTLLDNAARSIAGTDAAVDVSMSVERGNAAIRIDDEGHGIPSVLLSKLGHEPVQSVTGGQGIGLLLAFATARQIGATIVLAPRSPCGISASLTVPLT